MGFSRQIDAVNAISECLGGTSHFGPHGELEAWSDIENSGIPFPGNDPVTFEFPQGQYVVPEQNSLITIKVPGRIGILQDLHIYRFNPISGNVLLPALAENIQPGLLFNIEVEEVIIEVGAWENNGDTFIDMFTVDGHYGNLDSVTLRIEYGIQTQEMADFGWLM